MDMDDQSHLKGPADRPLPNILITGVPGSGKTTLSQLLEAQLNESLNSHFKTTNKVYFRHLNMGQVINDNNLYKGFDEKRQCSIFDDDKVIDFLEPIVSQGGCLVDFHSSDFFPERYFDLVLLLRVDNTALYGRLKERGYAQEKITENIDCELLETVKDEVFESYQENIIVEARNDTQEDMKKLMSLVFERLKQMEFLKRLEAGESLPY